LTALIASALVIRREGIDLTRVVADQTILTVYEGVRDGRHFSHLSDLVAHNAAIILPTLVIVGNGCDLVWAVALQAVLPAFGRVRDPRHLQQREAIGRSGDQ
jgi:hypothetical protein